MAHEKFLKEASSFGPPERLALLLEAERAGMSKEEFFNGTGHQPLKDAWQAAVFGLGYQELIRRPAMVRLSSHEEFPDFQLRVDDATHDFECVMVVRGALGKEFRGDKSLGPVVGKRPSTLPLLDMEPIQKVVAKKAAKHYQGTVHLLVYLNEAGAGGEYAKLAPEVRGASGGAFESIWLVVFGAESGTGGEGTYFISCALPSSLLARADGWQQVPQSDGESL